MKINKLERIIKGIDIPSTPKKIVILESCIGNKYEKDSTYWNCGVCMLKKTHNNKLYKKVKDAVTKAISFSKASFSFGIHAMTSDITKGIKIKLDK